MGLLQHRRSINSIVTIPAQEPPTVVQIFIDAYNSGINRGEMCKLCHEIPLLVKQKMDCAKICKGAGLKQKSVLEPIISVTLGFTVSKPNPISPMAESSFLKICLASSRKLILNTCCNNTEEGLK